MTVRRRRAHGTRPPRRDTARRSRVNCAPDLQHLTWFARLTRLPLLFAAVALLVTLGCDPGSRMMATYMGTPSPVARAMLELAKTGPNDVVYDLGSGDGRIVIMAAKNFGARGVGIDIDPKLVALARENARLAGVEDKVKFTEADIFQADISAATVVTLYLYDTVNLRLRPKLLADLAPGTRVVSHEWGMGDWKPETQRSIDDTRIYLWRIPPRAASLPSTQSLSLLPSFAR